MMNFMKLFLLSSVLAGSSVCVGPVAMNVDCGEELRTAQQTDVSPRWIAENTTGWLTDSQGMLRLKIRYSYIDGTSPRFYDILGVASGYYATSGSVESGSLQITNYTISSNERSAVVYISYRIRNAGISTTYNGFVQFGI